MRNIREVTGKVLGETKVHTMKKPLEISRPEALSKAESFFGFRTLGDPGLQTMALAARQFLIDIWRGQVEPYWLTFLGPSGTGKTMLARKIYECVWSGPRWTTVEGRHHDVARVVRPVQFRDWRRVSQGLYNGQWEQIDDLCSDWFVVLDDVGADEDPRQLALGKLDLVLNARLRKWTILTSNYSPIEIAKKLDYRIVSRMKRGGSRILANDAMDFNMRPASAAQTRSENLPVPQTSGQILCDK